MFALDNKKIIDSLRNLPEKLQLKKQWGTPHIFTRKIEKGIKQPDEGQCISHEEAKEKMKKWLK